MVKQKTVFRFLAVFAAVSLLFGFGQWAGAQTAVKTSAVERWVTLAKDLEKNLPPEVRPFTSSKARLILSLAEKGAAFKQLGGGEMPTAPLLPGNSGNTSAVRGLANNPFSVEDSLSRLGGTTQNETTVAWCGNNVVVGFNDSGSFAGTVAGMFSPSRSFSFVGWAHSGDQGATFVDRGALVSDPLPSGTIFVDLLGDPVVRCSSESIFYFASLAFEFKTGQVSTGVSVQKSLDGGKTFGGAVMAVRKSAFGHFVDKEWLEVRGEVVHVTYTDFDFSGFFSATVSCKGFRTAIEHVRSLDGGATWSKPQVLAEKCGFEEIVQSSQITAGIGNDVYAAWENIPLFGFGSRHEIQVRRSDDQGAFFGPVNLVSGITDVGSFLMQGGFRSGVGLQGLAVDKSTGNVYAVWHDGRNLVSPDPVLLNYNFSDVLLAKSTDRGQTWSQPVRVNDDPLGLQADQFQPALAVSPKGDIHVLFYDRREDARNLQINAFLAVSRDAGQTFRNEKLTVTPFFPVVGQDFLVGFGYMGDYNAVAVDSLGLAGGVIAAWGDNSLGTPDVRVEKR